MMTASEYINMTAERKMAFALAVAVIDRMCADSVSLLRRMQICNISTQSGRAEYERLETALLCKRNEVMARQFDFHLQGISITISTDDKGWPIRVRRPLGFESLDQIAARKAAETRGDEEEDNTPLPRAAARMTKKRA